MAVVIDAERCKGCGLCREACPQGVLALGSALNSRGQYFAVAADPRRCIGCGACSISCPDAAIEVLAWGAFYQCFAY